MRLKEQLAVDLATFLNVDEFAEEVELDGVKLTAQISPHTAEKSERLTETFAGLHGDFVTIYFKTAAYVSVKGKLPVQGQWCLVNGRRFDVMSCAEQGGVTKLLCAAYRQARR